MALCDTVIIDYAELRERLMAEIARRDVDASEPGDYWAAWQDALESILSARGLFGPDEIAMRAELFAQHR
jgi:hypothetical protein